MSCAILNQLAMLSYMYCLFPICVGSSLRFSMYFDRHTSDIRITLHIGNSRRQLQPVARHIGTSVRILKHYAAAHSDQIQIGPD